MRPTWRPRPRTLQPRTLLLLPLLLAGCGDGSSGAAVAVTDSAGVTMVHSARPSWGDGARWSVSFSPRLELTSGPEDPGNIIHEVTGVVVLPDGRVAIANRGDNSVRMYDERGALLWRAGGSGGGPDEFRDLRGLALLGDEIWAYQLLPAPVKVFDLSGRLLRSAAVPAVGGPNLKGVLADGSIVATGRPRGSPAGRVWTQLTSLIRFREGVTDTLAVLPLLRRVDLGSLGHESQALGPNLHVAAGGGLVYAGYSSAFDISVWDRSGRLIRKIRRAVDPEPVTSRHRDAYRETLIAAGRENPGLEEAYRELANAMVFPEYHAAHDHLIVDGTGVLWVQRPQTEPPWEEAMDYTPVPAHRSEWDVFAPGGEWLGSVTLPARFRAMDIGPGHVAGVWKDELGVERVQLWDLRKPAPGRRPNAGTGGTE